MKRGAPPHRRPAPMVAAERSISDDAVQVTLPLHVVNAKNQREHWTETAKRTKTERRTVGDYMRSAMSHWKGLQWDEGSFLIRLTRIAPCKLDSDNVQRALSAVRDGVADAIGIDDGSERLTWTYEQEKQHAYGVRIEIRERT